MKLKLDKTLTDYEGNPMHADEKGTVLNLRRACMVALTATFEDEKNMSGEDKFKRGVLAQKVMDKDADFTVEDVAEIKKCVGKAFNSWVVVQSWNMLESEK